MNKRIVVVPAVLGTLACSGVVEPPDGPPRPPPAGPPPKTLNWSSPQHGTIYRGNGSCYVHLPFPEPPSSWQPAPTQAIDCPRAMRSDAWDACIGGMLMLQAEDSCVCDVDGNPPPPPATVPCPPHTGDHDG